MKIEMRPIDTIRGYENNPRKNETAIPAIAKSLEEFGWRQPIVVDASGTIVVGHTRWMAAKSIGMKEIPVHVADGLTPEQIRAYRLADNKLNEISDWDPALLKVELSELKVCGTDILGLGFTENEIEVITGEFRANEIAMQGMKNGDRNPFMNMKFILHDDQVPIIKDAIKKARAEGGFDSKNENENGNALARICQAYLNE